MTYSVQVLSTRNLKENLSKMNRQTQFEKKGHLPSELCIYKNHQIVTCPMLSYKDSFRNGQLPVKIQKSTSQCLCLEAESILCFFFLSWFRYKMQPK